MHLNKNGEIEMVFGVGLLVGLVIMYCIMKAVYVKKMLSMQSEIIKNMQISQLLSNWIQMYQMKKNMVPYIADRGYKNIAIYGMGVLGQRLYDELEESDITVKYAIDRNAINIKDLVDVKHPSEEMEPVDAIIVSSLYYFEEIKNTLESRVECPIISIKDCLAPEYRTMA